MLSANTSRDLSQAARTAATFLKAHGVELPHAQALELVSRLLGYPNHMAAKASLLQPGVPSSSTTSAPADDEFDLFEGSATPAKYPLSDMAEIRRNVQRYAATRAKPDALGVRRSGNCWVLMLRYSDYERDLTASSAGTHDDALAAMHNLAAHYKMGVETPAGYAQYLVQRWARGNETHRYAQTPVFGATSQESLEALAARLVKAGFAPATERLAEMSRQLADRAYLFCAMAPSVVPGKVTLDIGVRKNREDKLPGHVEFSFDITADVEVELFRLTTLLQSEASKALHKIALRTPGQQSSS